jgi:hypothetical protein
VLAESALSVVRTGRSPIFEITKMLHDFFDTTRSVVRSVIIVRDVSTRIFLLFHSGMRKRRSDYCRRQRRTVKAMMPLLGSSWSDHSRREFGGSVVFLSNIVRETLKDSANTAC